MKSQIPNSEGVISSYGLNNTFFFVDKTKKIFPKLNFTKNSIPVGESTPLCVTLSWAQKDRNILFYNNRRKEL